MKRFFVKKYIFAACFLVCLLAFSVCNLLHEKETLQELGESLLEVDGIDSLKSWISSVESELNEEILGRMGFIESYGYLQKLMGKREFDNFSVIKGDDGMLYYGSLLQGSTEDLKGYAKQILRAKEYAESKGAKLLVVLPPSKVLPSLSDLNSEWPVNDPNYRMDKLLLYLQQYGVDAVDLRPAMERSGRSLQELFFNTDHHWTPLAAFYGVQEIVRQVRQRFGDDWDPTGRYCDLSNYNSYTYTQCFLGSNGRNTGATYSGLEDYTLLWPQFDTDLTWFDYDHNKEYSGRFENSVLYPPALEMSSLYRGGVNDIYLREIVDQDAIVNNQLPDGPRLKVLRDSYFSPMACFLAPMCSEIDMVWNRSGEDASYYDDFIKEGEYDYLIIEVYPYNLDEKSFNFFLEDEQ